ncbi:MAG: phosphoenolpyruvate mutase [Gammaproteobacteria bacterium]
MSIVYMALSADFFHSGHLKIIKKGQALGELIVGVLTDKAVASYKRAPVLSYDQRKEVAENIKGVSQVIPQHSFSYIENLESLKPDYVIHGDDWKIGFGCKIREEVIKTLDKWGGELVELPYTPGLSSSYIAEDLRQKGINAVNRQESLRHLLDIKPVLRMLEVHNGLTGLIAEKTKVDNDNGLLEFDGMWESSLTDSVSKGKPDNASVDMSSRVSTIEQILEVTTKPIIVDADNGGLNEHFKFTVRTLERLGVSAIIIEDKIGAKRNSLFGTEASQQQDSCENFCEKIRVGKNAQVSPAMMLIARVESLILKKGMDDALARAKQYAGAGADGIMIHSCEKTPDEILEFCAKFRVFSKDIPLVVVPTSYNIVTEAELSQAGINIVIYANHMLRSAYPAMVQTAESILKHGRAHEVSDLCLPIKDILNLIPVS